MERAKDESGTGRSVLETQIGTAVKGERSRAGLTLTELSSKSGISAPMISKIERGQVSASLATLSAIAQAIGVPIINFFAGTVEIGEVSFVRHNEGIDMRRAGSTYGHGYKELGRITAGGVEIEIFAVTYHGDVSGTPIFQHVGAEAMHCLSGQLTYRVGNVSYEMKPGDTLSFEANIPHGPQHVDSNAAQFLTVIARPRQVYS
ncbi:MAG: hypothetical protein ABS75_00935 [Pelagibacterium sp. SCN 63-23]|nr:MAG: hypothetical protein ABS75_00935 [Pelagibacterium sp. SCN 63-23]